MGFTNATKENEFTNAKSPNLFLPISNFNRKRQLFVRKLTNDREFLQYLEKSFNYYVQQKFREDFGKIEERIDFVKNTMTCFDYNTYAPELQNQLEDLIQELDNLIHTPLHDDRVTIYKQFLVSKHKNHLYHHPVHNKD